MKLPTAKPHSVVYGEWHLERALRQLDGFVTGPLGIPIPIAVFLRDLWNSAIAEGYANGYVQHQIDRFEWEHCEEPPASTVGEWQKRAARKASGE